MEIDEQLLLLKEIKDNIGISIENKGVSIPVGTPYVNYGDLVREISVRYGVELSKINENFTREITDKVNIVKPDTLNVTNVGGVNISPDCVASGFSTSPKYLQFAQAFSPLNMDNWELGIKIKCGLNSAQQVIFCSAISATNSGRFALFLFIDSNNRLQFNDAASSSSWSDGYVFSSSLTNNAIYYIKIVGEGLKRTFYLSTDGINYNKQGEVTRSSVYNGGLTATSIGLRNSGSYVEPFQGSIYLKDCYIKLNNQIWWQGVTEGEVIL